MDTMTAILTHLHTILTEDATLKAAMGGPVRLYLGWGVADAATPYLVHRMEFKAPSDVFPMREGTYILDIWSDTDNADEALSIRNRVITLLDELSFDTTDDDVTSCRLWLQTDGMIVEEGYWHIATQWNLRFYRTVETANILNR